MREETQMPETVEKTGKGRKVLVAFGIIFIAFAVFLGSFACSFQVMIESAKGSNLDEGSLEGENKKLKADVQLLQDQITILEGELDKYKEEATDEPEATSTSKSGATATAKKKSSSTESGSSATKTSAPKENSSTKTSSPTKSSTPKKTSSPTKAPSTKTEAPVRTATPVGEQ